MSPTGRCWTGDSPRCISNWFAGVTPRRNPARFFALALRPRAKETAPLRVARTMVGVSSALSKWGSSGLAYLTGLPDGPPDFSRANVLAHAECVGRRDRRPHGRCGGRGQPAGRSGRAAGVGPRRPGVGRWRHPAAGRARRLVRDHAVPPRRRRGRARAAAGRRRARRPVAGAASIGPPHVGCLRHHRAARLCSTSRRPAWARSRPPRRGFAPGAPSVEPRELPGLLVADLSSMWAGPLCGQLLARAGATVVKVESPRRPDGTRAGNRAFFDWINGEKLSYCVDFDSQAEELRELLAVADVVIEGSRPAALARRRLGPDDVAPRAGRIWLRITGYDGDPGRRVRRRRRGGRRAGRYQRRGTGVLRRRHRRPADRAGGDPGGGRIAAAGAAAS